MQAPRSLPPTCTFRRRTFGIRVLQLDVTQPAAIAAVCQQVGAVDVLFNCAGYVHSGALLDCDEQAWRFSFDLNVTAMYRMISAFLPGMLAAGGGSIINMASVASSVKGVQPLCLHRKQGRQLSA